jgi:hypothetical protein
MTPDKLPRATNGASEDKVSMVEIKALVKAKLKPDSPVLKRILDEPDFLPRTSATIERLLLYWELVVLSLEEA